MVIVGPDFQTADEDVVVSAIRTAEEDAGKNDIVEDAGSGKSEAEEETNEGELS